jgi:hypothetical protein
MNKYHRLLMIGLTLTSLLGCGVSGPADGSLKCAAGEPACPEGYVCYAADHTCWRKGSVPDAANTTADATLVNESGDTGAEASSRADGALDRQAGSDLPDSGPGVVLGGDGSADLASDHSNPDLSTPPGDTPDSPDSSLVSDGDGPDGGKLDVPRLDAPIDPAEVGDAPAGAETNPSCSKDTDCPGPCQSCSTSHTCVAVTSKDDPSGHCAGTCDANGACKAGVGQACASASACANDTCVDGYCCERACNGTCEACDITPGKCTILASGASPHAGHGTCTATDPTCAGKCDGSSGTCFYTTVACGTASCTGSTLQPAGSCNAGACSAQPSRACPTNETCSANACACLSPMLSCSDACIDPMKDASNCDACGHSCQGGQCLSGQCQPVAVVSNPGTSPNVFGLDDGHVYYSVNDSTTGISNVYRVAKDATNITTNPTSLASASSGEESFSGVIGNKLIKQSRGDRDQLCDIDNCTSTWTDFPTTSAGLGLPYAFFTSPSPTYYAECDSKTNAQFLTVTWYSTSNVQVGSPYTDSVSALQTPTWSSFQAYGNNVYWIRRLYDASSALVDASVYSVSMSSTTSVHLAGSLGDDMYLCDVNEKSILIVDASNLYRIPLPVGLGSQAPQKLVTLATSSGGYYTLGATEDASGVYWLDNDGSLYRCTPSSSTGACTDVKILASGQAQCSYLYQDATALYWGSGSTNQVMRLAK